MARDRRSHAEEILTLCRSFEPGRARFGIQRHGRVVAGGIRHASATIRRGARSPVGAGPATLSFAIHVCAGASVPEVWCPSGADQWTDSGTFAGESVGPG